MRKNALLALLWLWLGFCFACAAAVDAFTAEFLDALLYVVVFVSAIVVLMPHPTALSKPQLNEVRLADCDSSKVDYARIVRTETPATHKQYLVVGAGFVGKKLIHSLLLRGEAKIRVFDADPSACSAFKHDPRVEFIHGDVTNYDQVLQAAQGVEHVFATFAVIRFMDRLSHQAAFSFKVNVVGTENLLRACQASGCELLVQTSTSNVSVSKLAGKTSMDMNEKLPYVTKEEAPNHYGWTKAISEQLVLNASGVKGMVTASVRPCSAVFGADDRHLLDPLIKLGRSLLPPNGGAGVIDFIGVNNVVFGHLLCEKALMENPEGVQGEAFCMSNENPMTMRDFLGIVERMRPGGLTLIPTPELLLQGVAYGVELAKWARIPVPRGLDPLTGCLIEYLNLNYAFNSRKARELLGYRPLFTVEQGVDLALKEWVAGKMLPEL